MPANPSDTPAAKDTLMYCHRQGKLCLVLDLDHTLINSARFTEVEPEHEALLRHHMAGEANRLTEDRQIFRIERIQMWTKLRPAVRQFLYAASQQFELWIHTNGNKCVHLCSMLVEQVASSIGTPHSIVF